MKSTYADRETVGSIYNRAQGNSDNRLTIGDVGSEMVKSLVDDLNDTIQSNPFDGKSFYISVVEHKDLQMKNAIKRRLFVSQYLPYPEDNTLVFFVDPRSQRIEYCWDIPHHSEIPNVLSNEFLYESEYVHRIKCYLKNDLSEFGFTKVHLNSSQIEGYCEKTINAYRDSYITFLKNTGCDEKTIESEKKLGFFWIPNKLFKRKSLDDNRPKIFLA